MKKYLFFFSLLISTLYSQSFENSIIGRVTEKQTGKPIPGVNVYLNETMCGTTSDVMGYFKIRSIVPGNHEIIASMIGYEFFSGIVSIKPDTNLKYDIELSEKVYEFGTVEVIAEKPALWLEQLGTFKRIFLGVSGVSKDCEIVNEYALEFSENAGVFKASSKEPLKVNNNFLGYEINCNLLSFTYDLQKESVSYTVKTFFKEYESDDNVKKDAWKKNRQYVYYGSLSHFLRSLVLNNTIEEGFDIKLTQAPDLRKTKEDIVGFKSITPGEIAKRDTTYLTVRISFNDYLRVVYRNKTNNSNEYSYLKLNNFAVDLDEYGVSFEMMPFQTMGSWARRGVADMLPKYFKPL